MIDIIIPAYNSHDTIIRTLGSVVAQLNRDELVVTIVNDGGNDYQEILNIFKPLINIREIGYKKNKGPGYARQYGINYTVSEYIVFMDADDTLLGAGALELMRMTLENSNAEFLISPFIQYGTTAGAQELKAANLTWVFSHMYRRRFLEENNISFTATRANEDVGFNLICAVAAHYHKGDEGIVVLDTPTYEWQYNPNSITLEKNAIYTRGISIPGYIYNVYNAYNTLVNNIKVPIQFIAYNILQSAFGIYFYYNLALIHNIHPNILNVIEELSKNFFHYYYNQIIKYIPEEVRMQTYWSLLQDDQAPVSSNDLQISFEDFIKLMSQQITQIVDYEKIETELKAIAENSI